MNRARIMRIPVLLLALVLCAGATVAGTDKLAVILQQQRALAAELDTGAIDLTPRQKDIVRKSQQEVFALTEGKAALSDLSIADQAKLENALERINAQIVGSRRAEEVQQVCKRVAVTGSAMKKTRCASREEWDQLRETSRKALEKQQVCQPPGCGQ